MINQINKVNNNNFMLSSEHPSMDYTFLRQEGIKHLERMAGQLWTDFNAHDPGITILEQLCYAITDLGYRISYELPDILAEGDNNSVQSLYSPSQILTSHPVTLTDYRKIMLDVEGVKNAWIEKVVKPEVFLKHHVEKNELTAHLSSQPQLEAQSLEWESIHLKGLYRVLIETSDIDGSVVMPEVTQRLHAHRNLCEDFEEIRVLDTQKIKVDARIEIGAVDDAEKVLADVYEKISDYLSPSIQFLTLEQMLASGKPMDEIFDGPLLTHGFIDSETLNNLHRRTSIRTSDLIQEIMSVKGVRAVRTISIAETGGKPEAWLLEVDHKKAPKFDSEVSHITLEKDQFEVSIDLLKVKQLRTSMYSQSFPQATLDITPPTGRDRKIRNYFSIQHQFPAVYGLGELGLPASASQERKAHVKQLKAYLMFFDQLLANYFAQLAHVKDLFSFYGENRGTYFSQPVKDSNLGLDEIRTREINAHAVEIQKITENSIESRNSLQRKNLFLNHLLARFAEQFTDYSLILFGMTPEGIKAEEKMIKDKQAFLQNYPEISSARGTSSNYLQPLSKDNVSGLQKRIQLKLGLMEEEQFFLIEHILLRPMEEDIQKESQEDVQQQIPLLSAVKTRDPYSLQLSFIFPENWPSRFKLPEDKEKKVRFMSFVEQAVREETPAHITPYVHWLDKDGMEKFKSIYKDWLEKRRTYWSNKIG